MEVLINGKHHTHTANPVTAYDVCGNPHTIKPIDYHLYNFTSFTKLIIDGAEISPESEEGMEGMKRLTARSPKNNMAYLANVKEDEQVLEGSYNTLICVRNSFELLAKYEETGLTPEQILALRAKTTLNVFDSDLVKAYDGSALDKADQYIKKLEELLKQSKEALEYCILSGCRPAQGVAESVICSIAKQIGGTER